MRPVRVVLVPPHLSFGSTDTAPGWMQGCHSVAGKWGANGHYFQKPRSYSRRNRVDAEGAVGQGGVSVLCRVKALLLKGLGISEGCTSLHQVGFLGIRTALEKDRAEDKEVPWLVIFLREERSYRVYKSLEEPYKTSDCHYIPTSLHPAPL